MPDEPDSSGLEQKTLTEDFNSDLKTILQLKHYIIPGTSNKQDLASNCKRIKLKHPNKISSGYSFF